MLQYLYCQLTSCLTRRPKTHFTRDILSRDSLTQAGNAKNISIYPLPPSGYLNCALLSQPKLLHMFNCTLRSGGLSQQWLTAVITPVRKHLVLPPCLTSDLYQLLLFCHVSSKKLLFIVGKGQLLTLT
jgi:hypothetical protein